MPQPGGQVAFLTCPYWEVLYEGNRAGGKTDALVMDFAQHVGKGYGAYWKGVLFRESAPQLDDVIGRTKKYFHQLFPGAKYLGSIGKQKWVFEDGEELHFRAMKTPEDYYKFHGHEYPWIAWEELTNWRNNECYESVKSLNRCSKEGVPIKYRSTCNPWGPGHFWVKKYFIDPAPVRTKIVSEEGKIRLRIHGELKENKFMNVEEYEAILRAIPDPHLRSAWLEGSWDIAAGGFFEGIWNPTKHIIKPFKIPSTWKYIIGFDWGYQKPGSLGIWAKSDGKVLPDGQYFPRGSIIRVDEWYMAETDHKGQTVPDKGLRLDNEKQAQGIFERTKDLPTIQWVADPSIFRNQSGPSIQRQFNKVCKLPFRAADNERIPGWQSVIRLLAESAKEAPEQPGLWIFNTCKEWLRTVPVLMRDSNNVEDIDTTAEDHIADETRYVCQTVRPPLRTNRLLI